MTLRFLRSAALVSTTLLIATVALWITSFFIRPPEHSLSITRDFHIAVLSGGFDNLPIGSLVLFSDKKFGPYHGSIIALSGDRGTLPRYQSACFGPAYGVYYRYFHWPDSGSTLWTLQISLVYPLVLFAVLPGAGLFRSLREGRARATA